MFPCTRGTYQHASKKKIHSFLIDILSEDQIDLISVSFPSLIFHSNVYSRAMGQASPCLSTFAAGQVAAYKMFEAINRKPLIDSYDTKGLQLDNIQGDIELRDVYFSYPARPDELIFNGLSLSISHGTKLALVGESGSGKSTVISLIERFYDPQAGEVLIDGINLKDFQLKWIRQKIGLVSQEPVLFASTIRENISYAKEGPTDEEIKATVEMANAAKFIDNLPQVSFYYFLSWYDFLAKHLKIYDELHFGFRV